MTLTHAPGLPYLFELHSAVQSKLYQTDGCVVWKCIQVVFYPKRKRTFALKYKLDTLQKENKKKSTFLSVNQKRTSVTYWWRWCLETESWQPSQCNFWIPAAFQKDSLVRPLTGSLNLLRGTCTKQVHCILWQLRIHWGISFISWPCLGWIKSEMMICSWQFLIPDRLKGQPLKHACMQHMHFYLFILPATFKFFSSSFFEMGQKQIPYTMGPG